MKALLSKDVGGPDRLVVEDVPEPTPGPGEVRVAVRACGVCFPDTLIIEDKYQFKPPRPFSPGSEVSGTVDVLGEGVEGFSPGQRVLGWAPYGGMAEKIVLKATDLAPFPESMSFEIASAFQMTYPTSHYALKDRAALQPGETLLVLGAGGGVGLAAVELGKAMGARVVAAASSAEKAELARTHGADAAVVYPRGPFDPAGRKALARLFKDAVGEAGADVVYDPVGGDYSEAALRAIAWEGRFLVVGFPAGIASLPLNLTLLKSCQVAGVFWGAFLIREPERHRRNLIELLALYDAGKLHPTVTEVFPLAEAGSAIAKLGARQALGKLVVAVTS